MLTKTEVINLIIYNMKKPVDCTNGDCVGVTGDNLAYTQEFYIKGVSDNSISYSLHLRFSDGSVNSVTPSYTKPDGEGTLIRWVVTKNDIFVHGSFELQIEGTNSTGLVFQTEIVRLCADESLAIEDKEYENPNSETLKLREETYRALKKITEQQNQLDENIGKINKTSLDLKADKSDTYTKSEIDTELAKKINEEDVYTAEEADDHFQRILTAGNNIKIDDNKQGKITISADLSKKYDAANVESGSGDLSLYSENVPVTSAKFNYQKVGDFVMLTFTVTFSASSMSAAKSYSLLGLPYRNDIILRKPIITTLKNKLGIAIAANTATLTIITQGEAVSVSDGESIQETLIYKIKK